MIARWKKKTHSINALSASFIVLGVTQNFDIWLPHYIIAMRRDLYWQKIKFQSDKSIQIFVLLDSFNAILFDDEWIWVELMSVICEFVTGVNE